MLERHDLAGVGPPLLRTRYGKHLLLDLAGTYLYIGVVFAHIASNPLDNSIRIT